MVGFKDFLAQVQEAPAGVLTGASSAPASAVRGKPRWRRT